MAQGTMKALLIERRIVTTARQISASAPTKRGTYVTRAGVPWSLIEQLRAQLQELQEAQQ